MVHMLKSLSLMYVFMISPPWCMTNTEVIKIETTMLPSTQEKTTSIAPMCTHINFVIPDKFNGDQCKNSSILSAPNGDSRIARYA